MALHDGVTEARVTHLRIDARLFGAAELTIVERPYTTSDEAASAFADQFSQVLQPLKAPLLGSPFEIGIRHVRCPDTVNCQAFGSNSAVQSSLSYSVFVEQHCLRLWPASCLYPDWVRQGGPTSTDRELTQ